jgi:hypothetical protein
MVEQKQKLPRESEDKIIEVSLKHVILAFSGLVIGSFTVGAGVVILKDYAKYRRQKAIIEAAKEMFTFIKYGGEISEWKKMEKTESTSKKQPSVKQSKS